MNKCSVIYFKNNQGGWDPVDLTEKVVNTMPEYLKGFCSPVLEAAKIAEDFSLYCVFSLDLSGGVLMLRGFASADAGESEEEAVPKALATAILTGIALKLGTPTVSLFLKGAEIKTIDVPKAEEYTYIKYEDVIDTEGMKDASVCIYVYSPEFRYVGSYSLEDGCILDKNGKKVNVEEDNEKFIRELFRLDKLCEDSNCGEGEG